MQRFLTPHLVRQVDAEYELRGVRPLQLMEQAAEEVTKEVMRIVPHKGSILIACGAGNNGGDGFCVARMLSERRPDCTVTVAASESVDSYSDCARINRSRLPSSVTVLTFEDYVARAHYTVVLDALVGAGGSANLRHPVLSQLEWLNAQTGDVRVALDVPTGFDCETGAVSNSAFVPDVTVTIGASKLGFLYNPTSVGKVIVVPLQCNNVHVEVPDRYTSHDTSDVEATLPDRRRTSTKFDHGRVLVIGGTTSMCGAPSLAAHAALAVGAGLVDMAAPRVHPLTPREVIATALLSTTDGYISKENETLLRSLFERASVIAIGPGLGAAAETINLLAKLLVIHVGKKPIVIDADGLRMLPMLGTLHRNVIITPHLGEFARLTSGGTIENNHNTLLLAEDYACRTGCTVHLKSVPAVTTQGTTSRIVTNGNPILGTPGSGDVLTGIIAGMCALGVEPFTAASLGAFLHAEAGRHLATTFRTIVASQIIHTLPHVIPPRPQHP